MKPSAAVLAALCSLSVAAAARADETPRTVHVYSTGGAVSVERFIGTTLTDDDEQWAQVCTTPCHVGVPAGTALRANGAFRASTPVVVGPRVTSITVSPCSTRNRAVGIALIPTGVVVSRFSAELAVLAQGASYGDDEVAPKPNTAATVVFATTAVLGVVATVVGIALVANSGTSVTTADAPGVLRF